MITNRLGKFDHPENVTIRSLGWETKTPDWIRLLRLWRYSLEAILRYRCNVCFAHMTPKFAALVGPICRLTRTPLVLWYAHTQVSSWLRAGVAMANACVTPASTTLRIDTPKRKLIGHGVSIERMRRVQPRRRPDGPIQIMHLGRMARVKNLAPLIRGLALLPPKVRKDFRVKLVGDPLSSADEAYRLELMQLSRDLGVAGQVEFAPGVPFADVARTYADADVAYNGAPAVDKAALEAMALGLPCIVLNAGFIEALGEEIGPLFAADGSPEAIARILTELHGRGAKARREIGARLQDGVMAQHSVDALVGRLFDVFGQLTRSPGAALSH